MKNAAKCDTSCDLQNPVNHRNFERILHFRVFLGACLSESSLAQLAPLLPGRPRPGGARADSEAAGEGSSSSRRRRRSGSRRVKRQVLGWIGCHYPSAPPWLDLFSTAAVAAEAAAASRSRPKKSRESAARGEDYSDHVHGAAASSRCWERAPGSRKEARKEQ